jgi:hypothetical protein
MQIKTISESNSLKLARRIASPISSRGEKRPSPIAQPCHSSAVTAVPAWSMDSNAEPTMVKYGLDPATIHPVSEAGIGGIDNSYQFEESGRSSCGRGGRKNTFECEGETSGNGDVSDCVGENGNGEGRISQRHAWKMRAAARNAMGGSRIRHIAVTSTDSVVFVRNRRSGFVVKAAQ